MVYSKNIWKFDKIDLAFVVFLLFLMLCNVTFCAEFEDVETTRIDGITFAPNSNYFLSGAYSRYFRVEKGYIYHIIAPSGTTILLCSSSELPAVNVPLDFISTLSGEFNTYDYLVTDDSYLYLTYTWGIDSVSVTREKITDMSGVVNILSNDVGTNQFWNIFSLAIPFFLVSVLVVFGFFIIRRLTKKDSKGDIMF